MGVRSYPLADSSEVLVQPHLGAVGRFCPGAGAVDGRGLHGERHRSFQQIGVVQLSPAQSTLQPVGQERAAEGIAGPDVCSPAIYREIAFPHERNVTQRLLKAGVRLQNHICGNATAIVPDMVETGAAILGLDYKCDLPAIKAATQGRATIVGTIDPSEIIARGTPDDVTEAARQELAILGPGGGLVLAAGCALPPETPADNLHALVEAGHTLGRYAPDGSPTL